MRCRSLLLEEGGSCAASGLSLCSGILLSTHQAVKPWTYGLFWTQFLLVSNYQLPITNFACFMVD